MQKRINEESKKQSEVHDKVLAKERAKSENARKEYEKNIKTIKNELSAKDVELEEIRIVCENFKQTVDKKDKQQEIKSLEQERETLKKAVEF